MPEGKKKTRPRKQSARIAALCVLVNVLHIQRAVGLHLLGCKPAPFPGKACEKSLRERSELCWDRERISERSRSARTALEPHGAHLMAQPRGDTALSSALSTSLPRTEQRRAPGRSS